MGKRLSWLRLIVHKTQVFKGGDYVRIAGNRPMYGTVRGARLSAVCPGEMSYEVEPDPRYTDGGTRGVATWLCNRLDLEVVTPLNDKEFAEMLSKS